MKIRYIYFGLIFFLSALNSCRKDTEGIGPDPIHGTETDTTDSGLGEVKPDIPSLYFLRDSDSYPKQQVSYYEIKNTEDTYYLHTEAEMSYKIKYSPTGKILKFESPRLDGDYRFNESGLPIRKYEHSNLVMEIFYNEKNSLAKVFEYFQWDSSFSRKFTYDYNVDNSLKEYTMHETNTVINNKQTVSVYPNLIVTGNSKRELNSQQLVVKINENVVAYSVEDNTITAKVVGKDDKVYWYYTISFDEHYKPAIPPYFNLYPIAYYDDMIINSLLNYAHRNPLKITYTQVTNTGEHRMDTEINYTYKYNVKGLPTEIFKVKELKNYLSPGNTVYSKQLIKIEY